MTVLAALATSRDVHLWLPAPSPTLWQKMTEHLERNGPPASRRRVDDHTEGLGGHRLLAYLGRDARELQLTLAATGVDLVDEHLPGPDGPSPGTLLTDCSRHRGLPAPLPSPPVRARPGDRIGPHSRPGPDRHF